MDWKTLISHCSVPFTWDFSGGSVVIYLLIQEPQEMRVQSLGQENPLEVEKATHSGILARITPWREKPGRLQSMGSQTVGHDYACMPFTSCFLTYVLIYGSI